MHPPSCLNINLWSNLPGHSNGCIREIIEETLVKTVGQDS